jgi:hypothetical protein
MALFDMLVHDTLLTSWQDHVLIDTLCFRTRDTDTFGSTDQKAEDAARLVKQRQDNHAGHAPDAALIRRPAAALAAIRRAPNSTNLTFAELSDVRRKMPPAPAKCRPGPPRQSCTSIF